jgi:N6-L-threonylcarbamoyladenine synthase
MLVLGIETSCDETALAIVRFENGNPDTVGSVSVIAERVSSQIPVHQLYGGVVPEIAAREHLRSLPLLLNDILTEASLSINEIDGIAVTQGPGLKGALLMGFSFAKGVAAAANKPLVGVNHIEGHLLSPLLSHSALDFPFLGLVVSGGHTELVEANAPGDYRIVSRTMDDAAGEAFDKAAALLGFDYPGGAALSRAAEGVTSSRFVLPRVMLERAGMSFSGLKTAVAQLVRREWDGLDKGCCAELSFTIEQTIVEVLVRKTLEALSQRDLSRIAVAGGVAANRGLRLGLERALREKNLPPPFFAEKRYCTDNAVMIALVGACRLAAGERLASRASVLSRWPIEEMRRPG